MRLLVIAIVVFSSPVMASHVPLTNATEKVIETLDSMGIDLSCLVKTDSGTFISNTTECVNGYLSAFGDTSLSCLSDSSEDGNESDDEKEAGDSSLLAISDECVTELNDYLSQYTNGFDIDSQIQKLSGLRAKFGF